MTPAELTARGVRVKPLEWTPWEYGRALAESTFGRYAIWDGHYRPPEAYGGIRSDNPEAAAQADYEARICAALTTGENDD